ncbi:MAG: hypothetical protein RLZZ480_600 [Candidatus Parcubacteria bacterium]|jgi:hypothetical protein
MSKTNILGFRLSEDDLRNQVENYQTLKITKSARGQVVLFFVALQIFSLIVLSFVNIGINVEDQLMGLILYIPLLFFTYKGHRWAIVGLMILWTLDKIFTIHYSITTGGTTPITSVVFLLIGLSICSMALQVENARSKIEEVK